MRVLMFGWEFPPYQAGGLATATVGLVKGLLRVGVDVTLVVPFPVTENPLPGLRLLGSESRPAGLTVHRIASPLEPYATAERYRDVLADTRNPVRPTAAVYGANLFEEVSRFAALAGEIATTEPHDVIDAHDWIAYAAGLEARRVSGRPLVAHIHATEFDRTGGEGNREIARRERVGLVEADRVVSNSRRLRDLCVQRYGIEERKVAVVHWGIDDGTEPGNGVIEANPLGPDTPVVLFVGRVTGQKGPDLFLEMAGMVGRFVPEAHFVVVGHGDMLAALIERSAELGIADRVHFAGGLGGEMVERAFRMAAVCVMPSRNEPFGLVALESLLNGTPCIIPKQAGVAEVVQHAFKVDSWDLEAMTDKVVAILKYPGLRSELAKRGKEELGLPRFGLEEPARLTAAVYRDLIESRS
jgi:glycosyltransferase involved in cell wall biosynthesis